MSSRLQIVIAIALLLGAALLAACGGPAEPAKSLDLAAVSQLPSALQAAPETVRTTYQFAISHPDALRNVPCYCGCGAIGHTSNLSCYVKEVDAAGKITFDDHATGCSICVDITQDVMRMTIEGREPAAIRSAIVETYSKFGPPNQ